MKQRLDKLLFELGLASTRSRAGSLISDGKVTVNGQIVLKPSTPTTPTDVIVVSEDYVGRGANKLQRALEVFQIEVTGKVCADLGASTGGFTQVLLEKGAKGVYAIDVGTAQLDPRLLKDPRVVNLEGVNVKNPFDLPETVELMVMDLSFISVRLVLENVGTHFGATGDLILLFKPQFEVGREHIPKDGVVKDQDLILRVLQEFEEWCLEKRIGILGLIKSPIHGKKGNTEFLWHLQWGTNLTRLFPQIWKEIL